MSVRSVVMVISRGVLALAVFWLTAFAVNEFAHLVSGTPLAAQIGRVLASAVGVWIAVRLDTRPVAYLLAGQLAYCMSLLAIQAVYGNRFLGGAPNQFAVMGAGTLGVLLGAALVARGGRIQKWTLLAGAPTPVGSNRTSAGHTTRKLSPNAA